MPTATRTFIAAALLALAALSPPAHAQNPVADSQVHLREAAAAYRAEDYASYARSLETAHELNPASLYTRHNLAGAYALTGRTDEALRVLRGLVNARVDFGMAADEDFEALRALDDFTALTAALTDNTRPIVRSSAYYEMPQLDVIPEGIAADSETQRLFFGSMRSGNVYVLDAERQLAKFATVDRNNKRAAIGMTVDNDRGVLWVVSTAFELAENHREGDPIETGLVAFDLKTGAKVNEYAAEATGFGLNDVAVGPNGELYASGDTLQVLDAERNELVPLLTDPALFGTNGVAPAAHGRTLFVSSYPVGIAAIDVATGKQRFLDTPQDLSLYGVDGMYWDDGDLVAVQNGIRPWRLVRLRLNGDETAIVEATIIELANEAITPTTGAIVEDKIYLLGQGPAPAAKPAHLPDNVAQFLGPTRVHVAPVDP